MRYRGCFHCSGGRWFRYTVSESGCYKLAKELERKYGGRCIEVNLYYKSLDKKVKGRFYKKIKF